MSTKKEHKTTSRSSRVKSSNKLNELTKSNAPNQYKNVIIKGITIKTDIQNHYKFGKKIGDGHSCDVAIKKISRSPIEETDARFKQFIQEITILKLCKHPHIVKYIDLYIDDKYIYIVMEYLKGAELFDFVLVKEKLSLDEIRDILVQIISAIEFCHGNLIAHRDLKLENIMMSRNGIIKLIDFGLSTIIDTDNITTTKCGSPQYVAPEILSENSYNPLQSDIWSIGIMLYIMATGNLPWTEQDNEERLYRQISNLRWDRDIEISPDILKTIEKILVKADKRITLQELKNEPWLKPYCLPSYLPQYEAHAETIHILVDKIITLGYDKMEILESIYDNKNNVINNIYRTLLKRYSGRTSNHNQIQKDTRITKSFQELQRINSVASTVST
jgi:serine/threonine protein kinase